jgi:hypothetical protein
MFLFQELGESVNAVLVVNVQLVKVSFDIQLLELFDGALTELFVSGFKEKSFVQKKVFVLKNSS